MNMQALQEQYPGVDIEKAKRHPKAKGHSLPTWDYYVQSKINSLGT